MPTVKIYIDGKEMLYSHQNMIRAINSFFPYLTNDDLTELSEYIPTLLKKRELKEAQSKLEAKNIPIQKNRHDTPQYNLQAGVPEHEQTWGDEYENPS
jgi:hypothetical protein